MPDSVSAPAPDPTVWITSDSNGNGAVLTQEAAGGPKAILR